MEAALRNLVAAALTISFSGNDASIAVTDTIPRWDVYEICATSALGCKCSKIESDSRRAVFNRWEARPLEDRQACEADVLTSGKRSYKALLTCLSDRALKSLDILDESPPARLPNSG
jgi:hypothetical protein